MNGAEYHFGRDKAGPAFWIGDLSQALATADIMPRRRGTGGGSDEAIRQGGRERQEWCGFPNWESATEHFEAGFWSDDMEAIEADVYSRQLTPGMQVNWDLAGDECDVGRFLAGEPESMICWNQPAQPATVQLIAPIAVSAICAVNTMRARGAAICAVIDTLESHGIAVDLIAQMGGADGEGAYDEKRLFWEITLKRSHQPLHKARIGAVLGHEAGYRMLGFRLSDSATPNNQHLHGYGVPAVFFDLGEHVLAPKINRCHDREYLTSWVRDTVANIIGAV